jgi:hypothetical protein
MSRFKLDPVVCPFYFTHVLLVFFISRQADTGCDSYSAILTDMLIVQALLTLTNCVFVCIVHWVPTADVRSITPAIVHGMSKHESWYAKNIRLVVFRFLNTVGYII